MSVMTVRRIVVGVLLTAVSAVAIAAPVNPALQALWGSDLYGENRLDGRYLDVRVYARPLTLREIHRVSRDAQAKLDESGLVWRGVPSPGDRCTEVRMADYAKGFSLVCWLEFRRTGGRILDNDVPGKSEGLLIDSLAGSLRVQLRGNRRLLHPDRFATGRPQCLVVTVTPDGTTRTWLNGRPDRPDRGVSAPNPGKELRYLRPARNWNEALPLGNGRLGAMAFGGVETERLQLNEDTIWTGGPVERGHEELTREKIENARRLVFGGKGNEAARSLPLRFRQTSKYQPFGDLVVRAHLPEGETTDYVRTLDLGEAVHRTSFSRGGVRFERESFASFTDQTVIHRLTADSPGEISFEACVETPQKVTRTIEGDTLVVCGKTGESPRNAGGRLAFEGRVTVRATGGAVKVADGKISVTGADEATIYTAIATNYRNFRDLTDDPRAKCRAALTAAAKKPYGRARRDHAAFYRSYADRCTLWLGRTADPAQPTDARLDVFARTDDPAFAALYFRYCRYLMISASQPGTEPMNLQGIWNKEMEPPWRSNHTLNINTAMIYWPAEATGLGDLAEPLWRLCDDLAVTGGEYAHDVYGAPGWVVHHNTDLWRTAGPCGPLSCALWPSGAAWQTLHIWYHWLYTHDRAFLKRHYATLKGAADFYVSQLVRDPASGRLTICPSCSPENAVNGKLGKALLIQRGAAMDHELARDLLGAVAEATTILGGDAAYAKKLRDTAAAVEPPHVGRWGQLQEWSDDLDSPTDRHRHTSHLYAVYPSNQITPETPKLFAAAKTSLEHRGDESTGWALAWRMNLWARFLDSERAYGFFRRLMRPACNHRNGREGSGSYYNLLDSCPPFVIDGNFGCLAGFVELFMQTHRGCIDLLPALPRAWSEGRIAGLCAPHGFRVEIVWMEGRLVFARITSDLGEPCTVRYAGKTLKLALKAGESAVLTGDSWNDKIGQGANRR